MKEWTTLLENPQAVKDLHSPTLGLYPFLLIDLIINPILDEVKISGYLTSKSTMGQYQCADRQVQVFRGSIVVSGSCDVIVQDIDVNSLTNARISDAGYIGNNNAVVDQYRYMDYAPEDIAMICCPVEIDFVEECSRRIIHPVTKVDLKVKTKMLNIVYSGFEVSVAGEKLSFIPT